MRGAEPGRPATLRSPPVPSRPASAPTRPWRPPVVDAADDPSARGPRRALPGRGSGSDQHHRPELVSLSEGLPVMRARGRRVGPACASVMGRLVPPADLVGGPGRYRSGGSPNRFMAQSVGGAMVGVAGVLVALLMDGASSPFSVAAVGSLRLLPLPARVAGADELARAHHHPRTYDVSHILAASPRRSRIPLRPCSNYLLG